MKKIFLGIILFIFSNSVFTQSFPCGKYESKQGSYLILNEDKSFEYFRSNSKRESDVISLDFVYQTHGKYKKKKNLLFFNSDELKIENNPRHKIKLDVIENKERATNYPDSINIRVNFDSKLFKLYLCESSLESLINIDDFGSCIELFKENRFELFKGEYYLRLYPNFDTPENRIIKQKTIYFESNRHCKKSVFSDLEINLEFDINNFNYDFFEDEIMLINNNKIYHEGQEFVLQKE